MRSFLCWMEYADQEGSVKYIVEAEDHKDAARIVAKTAKAVITEAEIEEGSGVFSDYFENINVSEFSLTGNRGVCGSDSSLSEFRVQSIDPVVVEAV